MMERVTLSWVAGAGTTAFGIGLIIMAGFIVVDPARGERFLRSFASSARAHYLEQGIRLASGLALLGHAVRMPFSDFFQILGLLLVITSIALLLMPWRWHHAFGHWAIPLAVRHMKLWASSAFLLGAFVLYGSVAEWLF